MKLSTAAVALAAALAASPGALAQFAQQGPKLVAIDPADEQGTSVALSADGNTAIVGGDAAFVWIRSGGTWSQQGTRLLVNDGVNLISQFSVALSADGNTALIGNASDNTQGAAWVWTRSGGVWTQQGGKLVATGAASRQGRAVALSADGDTAIIGGPAGGVGGAAIWTRSGGMWTLLMTLEGSDSPFQGTSVALSADAKTALVGWNGDDNNHGAVWPFVASTGLSIVKASVAAGVVEPGRTFGYVLAVTNAGPSTAANVTVTDALPPGLTLFSPPAGSGWTCGQAAGTVTCTAASLPLGVAPPIGIGVTAPSSPATLTNVAKVSSSSPDPDLTDNTATNVTVVAVTDLDVANTTSTVTAFGLFPFTHTLTVTNAGPSDAVGIIVTDLLAPGTRFVSASGSGWSCEDETFIVVCTRPLLAVGAAPPIILTIMPGNPPFGMTLSNTAIVASTTFDPNPANNRSTSAIVLVPASEIPALGSGALALLVAALGAIGFIAVSRRG